MKIEKNELFEESKMVKIVKDGFEIEMTTTEFKDVFTSIFKCETQVLSYRIDGTNTNSSGVSESMYFDSNKNMIKPIKKKYSSKTKRSNVWKRWTVDDFAYLSDHYGKKKVSVIAKKLKRNTHSVRVMASKIGLTKKNN